jgi:hypothetical protein
MESIHTENADEAARRILTLFGKQKARPGHILNEGYFFTNFAVGQLTVIDFRVGCDLAIQQDWIKETEPGVFMLRPAGYSAYH